MFEPKATIFLSCSDTMWSVWGCAAFIIPLDFTRELDRTPNVPTVQVELRVEVFLGCDGSGVVRTGTLGHVALTEGQRRSRQCSSEDASAVRGTYEPTCTVETLTPLWAVCCSAMPRKDCSGVFEPERMKNWHVLNSQKAWNTDVSESYNSQTYF